MASSVAKATSNSCTSQMIPLASAQEKGSRNKRKFRADPPLGDPNKILPSPQNECQGYEFSAERFEATQVHGQSITYDCDGLKLDIGLSGALGVCDIGTSQSREDIQFVASHDADWSDLTESELELLVLSYLDAIFKSAIKKIVACGYPEEVATESVLRSGLCYGCKDTVSNIVDNTLAFLRNSQGIDPSREQYRFEDLQQLEKYILAESVCVLQEVRPFFSTGDAMWCLLICDMNVSHACALDVDPLSSLAADEASIGSSAVSYQPQVDAESRSYKLNLPNPCKSVPAISSCQTPQSDASTNPTFVPTVTKPKNSTGASASVSGKEGLNSAIAHADKSSSIAVNSQSHVLDEKFVVPKKVHSGSTKCLLRQKSLHLEKSYRMYGSKGSRKLSGFGGLILDKKLRSVSESTSGSIKSASLRLSKAMGVNIPLDDGSKSPCKPELSSPASVNAETLNAVPSFVKTNILSSASQAETLISPTTATPPALSFADTSLSLSLPAKSDSSSVPNLSNFEAPNISCYGIARDKPLVQWFSEDKKNEVIVKLLPRIGELQNQLQEWTEWANQKVMQAARRLSKDKVELRSLRQDKEEVERLKKGKQSLEENTMKKLSEMENALCKAVGQVERANSAFRKLEVENAVLRKEMEAAKLHAAASAASCREASKRETTTLREFRSWEKLKNQLQEDLATEKRKVAQLLPYVELAKQQQEQHEARWQQEEKAKEELLSQAASLRKEREELDASTKSKENMIKIKAETDLQKYKDDIQKLQKEISQLRLKSDSSKIAALRMGIDGSYASRLTDGKSNPGQRESWTQYVSELVSDFHDFTEKGGVKRERECVMCLSEEMSVVFLPCAHQVVCTTCNELHEKQGMKDCPSCRSTIQRRIPVCYARS